MSLENRQYGRKLESVRLTGTAHQRGEYYGKRFSSELHAFLEDDLARINGLRASPLTRIQAIEHAKQCSPYIEADIPEIAEELDAIARGSGLSYFETILLQIRRELTNAGPDCTTYAQGSIPGSPALLGQTIDLSSQLADLALVLNIIPASGPETIIFTHLGLMGYMGFNSAGIAIGINMVRSPAWKAGTPPYLMVRQMLAQSTLEDCLAIVDRVRRTSARSLMLIQASRVINIEMTDREHRITEGEILRHTNHYLHPDLATHNNAPPPFSSADRLARLAALTHKRLDLDDATSWLSDHHGGPYSICMHTKERTSPGTIGAVAIAPETGTMWACRGNPCASPFHKFQLGSSTS